MTTIKKYFLSVLIFNTVCLSAMHTGFHVEEIRNWIDYSHLGINENTCTSPLTSSLCSYYKTCFMPKEKVAAELQKIESYIPRKNNRKDIFKKLVARHWYVYYLIQALVQEKIKEFCCVDGSTIDDFYNPDFTNDINGVKEMIHTQACKSFINYSRMNKPLHDQINQNLPYKSYNNIHFTVLYDDERNISTSFLEMSADGKYLKLNDQYNDIILWDMETGEQPAISKTEYSDIQWSSNKNRLSSNLDRHFIIDKTNNYCATSTEEVPTGKYHMIPVKVDKNKPAIILYKRETPLSYLGQCALENSENNKEKLIALKNSNSIKAIKGFPGKNLEKMIEKHITYLCPNQKVSNIIKRV